ncbi:type II toxin-antitoxin system RelE/ParE family toxin [Burkholderia sp. JP2-270]|uniref:type II toxin-antitoxin system RelE/ParE family toxin n=1 Tax=Burkholderia sp. JP2-270 TaxID=2217913 RepID=UPI001EF7E2EE|nr:type II toxin-antitoxin system RelE/ParE family toxin [Burkholderia sp. JP2-270]
MEALARGKKAGRTCIVRDGYFRYAAGSHVVFYRETDDALDVIRALHQRMDIERHLWPRTSSGVIVAKCPAIPA